MVLPGAPALISVVTLNFTANGGDGYPIKANGENFRYLLADGTLSAPVDEALDFTAPANVPANALGEQQAFGDYMQAFHGTPERPTTRPTRRSRTTPASRTSTSATTPCSRGRRRDRTMATTSSTARRTTT